MLPPAAHAPHRDEAGPVRSRRRCAPVCGIAGEDAHVSSLRPSFVTSRLRRAAMPLLVASIAALIAGPVCAANPPTAPSTTPFPTLVTASSSGGQGNADSYDPSISADGRFVAFGSHATNLVPGDTNGGADAGFGDDIFVRDRSAGTTELVSVSSAGEQGDADSYDPSISADGRFVAFYVRCGQPRGGRHERRGRHLRARPHDGHDGARERVQRREAGERLLRYALSISADGRFVAFDVRCLQPRGGRHERHGRRLRARPQEGHDESSSACRVPGSRGRPAPPTRRSPPTAASSPSGPPPPTSWRATRTSDDVFVRDRKKGTTELVSVSSAGKSGETARQAPRRSPPTAASSPSCSGPPT